jgi:hypothetical protein
VQCDQAKRCKCGYDGNRFANTAVPRSELCPACQEKIAALGGDRFTYDLLNDWCYGWGFSVNWSRGFVSAVRCDLAAWIIRGPRIVREHPVERVEVTDLRVTNDRTGPWVFWDDAMEPLRFHLPNLEPIGSPETFSAACLAWAKSAPVGPTAGATDEPGIAGRRNGG